MKDHICTTCNELHITSETHNETLNILKCSMLKSAAAQVVSTKVNDFKKSDIPDQNHSEYANFQKLKYHGLITKVRINGVTTRDRWLITRNGWAFLRGELKLPKTVRVKNNHTLPTDRSETLVSIVDVLKGSDYMETKFEYFDEDTGDMIGLRPTTQPEEQEQPTLLDVPQTKQPRWFA